MNLQVPERTHNEKRVPKIIAARICLEIMLASCVPVVYKAMPAVSIWLLLNAIITIVVISSIHMLCRSANLKILPQFFGREWNWRWSFLFATILPTICQTGVIIGKQLIVQNDGILYAEILVEIGVPIQYVMQYFINGYGTNWWGVGCCIASAACFFMAVPFCSIKTIMCALISSSIGCLRNSLNVRAASKESLPPDLNVVLQACLSLPIYLTFALIVRTDFKLITNMFSDGLIASISTLAILSLLGSMITVFYLYDIASPVTSSISSQMKGLVLTIWDLLNIDYWITNGLYQMVLCLFPFAIQIVEKGFFYRLREVFAPRYHEVSVILVISILLKAMSSGFYILEMRYHRKLTIRKEREKTNAVVATREDVP